MPQINDNEEYKTIEEYRKYVTEKIESFTPIFLKLAAGDFSAKIKLPEKEDEFSSLTTALSMVLDDLKFLDSENKKKTEVLQESLNKLKKSKEELRDKADDLERSRRALINILEDINSAKEVAEEEREKTMLIINNFSDGLIFFNEKNQISLANPLVEEIFNLKTEEIIGKSFNELGSFPSFSPLINLIGAEIKEVFRKELILSENSVLEASSIFILKNQERIGSLVILHDIIREKMIEKMKTEFVSIAAHQLRTPLSAIKWTLRMLLDGDLGDITSEQKDFIEKSYKSNERMISLINDLLNVTRIEEGRYLYKPTAEDMGEMIGSAILSLDQAIKEKRIKLEFKKPNELLPKIKADAEKIKLAINNIIDNAIKYTPVDGSVFIVLQLRKGDFLVKIQDTGMGIPGDQKERIFSKFFRGANAIKEETEGSGLGLYIAKNIIEAHGGKIWFESEEKKGTTFYISLPVEKEFEEFLKRF